MTIRLITLEREYGSGGGAIAEKVAARLGWKLWDQLLTAEIARRMDCDCRAVEQHEEKRDPAYYRLLKAFLRGSFEGSLNAKELAETVDRDRANFIAQYFKVEWPDRHRFHLMVNSGLGDEVAIETILDAVALAAKQRSLI